MTFDPEKPVQTRDGRKAEILCTDYCDDEKRNIIARIDLYNKGAESIPYFSDGRVSHYGDPHPCDLINIPEKRWAVIWKTEGEYGVAVVADEISLPDLKRNPAVIACLEFTEGDGL